MGEMTYKNRGPKINATYVNLEVYSRILFHFVVLTFARVGNDCIANSIQVLNKEPKYFQFKCE